MHEFFDVLDHATIGAVFCFIIWVIFGTLRRYLLARSNAAIQERVFSRIDSTPSLLELAGNEPGRRFLESLTLERAEPTSASRRILRAIQAGIVLTCFGLALLFLHHMLHEDPNAIALLVFGAGAVGLGIGFLIASAVSLSLSRSLGLLNHDAR